MIELKKNQPIRKTLITMYDPSISKQTKPFNIPLKTNIIHT